MFTMAYLKNLLLLIFVSLGGSNIPFAVHGDPQVPCYFIFGDSLSDNGNNNPLFTLSKANFPPYGIDFPSGPTGRFSNGQNTVDVIAKLVGFGQPIRPFANTTDTEIKRGVNYASGSAGIRDESGKTLGDNISLNKQLSNHNAIIYRLAKMMGDSAVKTYLKKCLYTVRIGTNDYIVNYFMPGSQTSYTYTPDQYAKALIFQYGQQINELYAAGARKIALFALGQLGCIPFEISSYGKNGSCADNVNSAVKLFDDRLRSLVDELNKDLADAKVVYINTTRILSRENLSTNGFTVLNSSCCPETAIDGCIPNYPPCGNRNEYVFFDGIHPTEAANNLTASRSYKAADASDAYPYDISTLIGPAIALREEGCLMAEEEKDNGIRLRE